MGMRLILEVFRDWDWYGEEYCKGELDVYAENSGMDGELR